MTQTKMIAAGDYRLNVAESGQGAPLLLVHGFPLDHTMWNAQLEGLADRRHVIAPDLPGFGSSELSGAFADDDPSALTMERLADSLAALLDALDIHEPITLCGLSMGGYIAFAFWRKHAARLGRLVLCDTRAAADPPDVAAGRLDAATHILETGTVQLSEEMPAKLFAPSTLEEASPLVEATKKVIAETDRLAVAAALTGMAQREDMTKALPSINLPALVICGAHDAITGPPEMRELAEQMPNARFVEIAAAGHMAPLEKSAEVNEAIRRFLDETDAAAESSTAPLQGS
jgi:pimeloyl-ACP methyl ester carboxylesterase